MTEIIIRGRQGGKISHLRSFFLRERLGVAHYQFLAWGYEISIDLDRPGVWRYSFAGNSGLASSVPRAARLARYWARSVRRRW